MRLATSAVCIAITMGFAALPQQLAAQNYRFSSVSIEGNKRIEQGTILSYAGIARGANVSAAELNDAYQRILGSGLFESVDISPRGGQLVITVKEYPTINQINIEGNRRLKDEDLKALIKSKSRLVFNPTVAERDAQDMASAYADAGRSAARVTPKIIRRSDNRVDLVFEVFEGGIVEVERISFVGNKAYPDSRLRRVLGSKQAGLLRLLIKKDTFVEDRVEFDKQMLRDFYLSRGYVDFRTTAVNAELAQQRDGYFMTFNVQEGQQFRFGEISTVSEIDGVDAAEFQAALKVRPGVVYSPTQVENSIARMERLAIKKGLDFVRVDPRITRNDRDLTLDVQFALVKGPRIFVERIDIEGNTSTLDQVVRRQFRIVEGDPFNPREIRESAERVRALGYFANANVEAREGTTPDQVIIDVDVEETTTGSLSFGGTYSTTSGFGLAVKFNENNFLGRGQKLNLSVSGGDSNRDYSLRFTEPALLGRNLSFDFDLAYLETTGQYSKYNTTTARISPAITFPLGERSSLGLRYKFQANDINNYSGGGALIAAEAAQRNLKTSSLGYVYSFDSRLNGLNPNAGVLLEFGQEFAGLGGDTKFVKSSAKAVAQTKVYNEEVTLRAVLEGGALNTLSGSSRVTDRFGFGQEIMRGFTPDGIGPREVVSAGGVVTSNDSLGGRFYAVARFEAEFPLGLPDEYNVKGGAFYDIGSVWGLDNRNANTLYESSSIRQVVGVSLFWKTPVGPLRFDWSKALKKEAFDKEQKFNLSISTDF